MSGTAMLTFTCCSCGRLGTACPECANTVAIDPETNLPPDIAVINGKAVTVQPSEDAVRRSAQQLICDTCVIRAIAGGKTNWMAAVERHARFHVLGWNSPLSGV
jgi:hypothetical protein